MKRVTTRVVEIKRFMTVTARVIGLHGVVQLVLLRTEYHGCDLQFCGKLHGYQVSYDIFMRVLISPFMY